LGVLPVLAGVSNGAESLKSEFVKTGLFLISGGGRNSLVRLSGDGIILVDAKLPGNFDALRAAVRKISDQPIRILINTSNGAESTGSNADFVKAGAHIVTRDDFKNGELAIHMGGIEADLMYLDKAHSASDAVVYFPNLKVVAIGDLYGSTLSPDVSTDGSLAGWSSALTKVLKLDFDVAVPSVGPPIKRADLEAFQTKLESRLKAGGRHTSNFLPASKPPSITHTDPLTKADSSEARNSAY
jgi:glyoxylase-like metal-dependent hydrolase (beta-lactamase superfamily II)